jgi:hypothetical protein
MFKTFFADKDTYITNKVIKSVRKTSSNVGNAGTLDLFKLYGASMSGTLPNTELTRLLIHFDIDKLKTLHESGRIDIGDSSFWCEMHLHDVYGGQPTPNNFTVDVFPLSSSFDEGLGRDIAHYSDYDSCNWLSSSFTTLWVSGGCSLACSANSGGGDYITSSFSLASTKASQYFKTGTEDLVVDITSLMSATLAGEIPDVGFRISFENSLEVNSKTYFVKRFASRTAFDETKRPHLLMGFDDSIYDDTQDLSLDTSCRLTFYNYNFGSLSNLTSGSSLSQITGSNCLLLKMSTPISGGYYNQYITGSQYSHGSSYVTGTYFADVTIPSSGTGLAAVIALSGSLEFVPVWQSIDNSLAYITGSTLTISPPVRSMSRRNKSLIVSVRDLKDRYTNSEEAIIRVHIFDQTSPLIKATKLPVELPGVIIKDVYYQIRDSVTDEAVVPFDLDKKSTKVSNDADGMFFVLDTSSLSSGRTYVIDVIIPIDGNNSEFRSVSSIFRVENYPTPLRT